MPSPNRCNAFAPRFVALLLISLPAVPVWSMDFRAAGMRLAQDVDADKNSFNQYDLIARFSLPWSWAAGRWRFDTLLDASVGMLKGGGDGSVIGSLGPALEMWPEGSNWRIIAGIRPTLTNDGIYGETDLGGNFYFTSFIGVRCQFSDRWGLGYQFSHMSNAGTNDDNPGLDLHNIVLLRSF